MLVLFFDRKGDRPRLWTVFYCILLYLILYFNGFTFLLYGAAVLEFPGSGADG